MLPQNRRTNLLEAELVPSSARKGRCWSEWIQSRPSLCFVTTVGRELHGGRDSVAVVAQARNACNQSTAPTPSTRCRSRSEKTDSAQLAAHDIHVDILGDSLADVFEQITDPKGAPETKYP